MIIPIWKPDKDTSVGTSYRHISLLCPAAKVLESLLLPTINKYIQPAPDQHGFRPDHLTTSALLQMTTYMAMGFNQRKPPDRTICVAVDLSVAFDTVCHKNLLSKINRSQLPPATARWLSCYLRGRQAKTCFRGVKSTSRKVNTGVPQGSKLSPSLFSFYIADMLRQTEPVKRVCYADDLEDSINNYLEEITAYLKDNSLLIYAPKSTVTLFSPDPHQAKTHPRILIEDSQLPVVQCPSILGGYLDTSLSVNRYSGYVVERVSIRSNILNTLACTRFSCAIMKSFGVTFFTTGCPSLHQPHAFGAVLKRPKSYFLSLNSTHIYIIGL